MDRLQQLLEDGVIDEVYSQLKSGKEAEVWLVSHRGEAVAAKLYKAREFRSFKNDAGYKEGRQVRNTRTQRAMDKGSRFGRDASEEAWKSAEADAMATLHAAGVRVPRPVLFYDGVLLMEVVGDAEGRVAPRLVDAGLTREQAGPMYRLLRDEVVKMLCADLIHGDLSEFNVLLGASGPVIIDFPQVVAAAKNSRSEQFFRRDLGNVLRFFTAFDPSLAALAFEADEIWRAYVRRDLSPGYEPRLRAGHGGGARGRHPGERDGGRRGEPRGGGPGAQGSGGQGGGRHERRDARPAADQPPRGGRRDGPGGSGGQHPRGDAPASQAGARGAGTAPHPGRGGDTPGARGPGGQQQVSRADAVPFSRPDGRGDSRGGGGGDSRGGGGTDGRGGGDSGRRGGGRSRGGRGRGGGVRDGSGGRGGGGATSGRPPGGGDGGTASAQPGSGRPDSPRGDERRGGGQAPASRGAPRGPEVSYSPRSAGGDPGARPPRGGPPRRRR